MACAARDSGRRRLMQRQARASRRRIAIGSSLLVESWGVATNAENIRARDIKVIAAAWRLIASTGVASLTVKALADEAGVAPSSMHLHDAEPCGGARASAGGDRAECPGSGQCPAR
ncbi:helix-turn-helix domain-containing protein [Brachybacterium tyrofermentans]|uniref:helix-turn-helix domain-containing protein n=1 Tax=Brachybacterium tyrofermentans TaxID=47848 RepID=UPI003FD07634